MKNYFQKVSDKEANIFIYGDIVTDSWKYEDSEVSSYSFKKLLEEIGKVEIINVHINSSGGDVQEGLAIYNLLKQNEAKIIVSIDGFACSIASVIAMAGDIIRMPETALMYIHNCWTHGVGNASDLRKIADDLDTIMEASIAAYMSKINITRDELEILLNEGKYLTAKQCLEKGFITHLIKVKDENIEESIKTLSFLIDENQRLKEKLHKNEVLELNSNKKINILENILNGMIKGGN